jgi:hypothetical protein
MKIEDALQSIVEPAPAFRINASGARRLAYSLRSPIALFVLSQALSCCGDVRPKPCFVVVGGKGVILRPEIASRLFVCAHRRPRRAT